MYYKILKEEYSSFRGESYFTECRLTIHNGDTFTGKSTFLVRDGVNEEAGFESSKADAIRQIESHLGKSKPVDLKLHNMVK